MPTGGLFGWWYFIGVLSKLALLLLFLVALYTLYFVRAVLVNLRRLRTANNGSFRQALGSLGHKAANLQQATLALFYFFLLVLFVQMEAAFWTLDNSKLSAVTLISKNFAMYFQFGVVASSGFCVVHSVQWFTSSRIRAAALRTDASATN